MKPSPRTPSKLSDSVHRQLSMYALAATAARVGVLALSQQAEARIIYTHAHRVIGTNEHYHLDLNHDGIADFTLVNSFSYSYLVSVEDLGSNGVAGIRHTGYAYALPAGANVGPALPFSGALMALYDPNGQSLTFGYWVNVRNRYLGLKFKIEGKTHYGWVRLNVKLVTDQGFTATLTGYAYETIPNKPIITGQTKGPDDDVGNDNPGASITNPVPDIPQPASLGALALGAPGLSIWRRRESVAGALGSN